MDRQAFRNRMQQLKQYREQNPGKTYLDFKQYADGREIPPSSTDETTDHPVNKPFIPSIIEAKDTATGKNFSDLTEYEKDLWRRSHGMDHYGKKIARGNLTEVYPEFDIITGIRGAINTVKNVGTSAYKELSVSDAFNKALNKSDKLEVLKNYPELGQVGTTFQYSKYVDDIFPDSKFNGIFYHGGKKGISKFHTPKDKDFILNKGVHSGTKDHGIYFTKDKLSAENYSRSYPKSNRNVYKVKLNSQNPYKTNDFIGVDIRSYFDKDYVNPRSITDRVRYGKLKNNDSVLWNGEKGEAVVFDPEQIHILGNNSDLKKFSEYTGNKFVDGGEVPPSNKPIIPEEPQPYKGKLYKDRYGRKYTEDQMNEYYDSSTDEIDRFTGKPFIRGLKPVGDIEDAANATPVGDAISAYDTYKALKNKDWGNAGLAALGLVPFVPSFGGVAVRSSKKISKPKSTYIPKVDPNYKQNVIDKALHEQKSYSDMPLSLVEEINDQRNRTYDLMQEPYARERAKAVDHQYGTDYLKVYDSMLEKYVDIDEYFQLPKPKYKKMERPTIGAQVTPSEGNTMYFNRDMIKTPEDIPNSVVLHEMGHLVDGATGMNNEFLRKLGDKSKFIPFNQAKTMYPNMTRDMYDNILQGTEIKSYMNQFRNYLDQKGKLNRGNYTGSYKNLKKEIIDAPKESFNNIKAIFNLYRSPKLFNKDFQMIPIVNNTNDNTIA